MRRLRRFGFNRIKEGFDQLPTAVCFFDNRKTHALLSVKHGLFWLVQIFTALLFYFL